MGGVSVVEFDSAAENTGSEISRLNALVATLRDEIASLRIELEQSPIAGDMSDFADDMGDEVADDMGDEVADDMGDEVADEIIATGSYIADVADDAGIVDVADVAPEFTDATSVAEAAAVAAADLAITAVSNDITTCDDVDNLLPYQIYCDRLTFVKGIDIEAARLLAGLGVTRFMDIAAFNAEDVGEVNAMLEAPGRICAQGWIEQAAMLASGKMTRFALQIERGEEREDQTTSSANVIDVDFTPAKSDEPATASADETLVADEISISVDTNEAEQIKVVDLGAARQKKMVKARTDCAKPKSAKRWSAVAASMVVLGSVIALGVTMSGTFGNWHEAFQNMAGLLM